MIKGYVFCLLKRHARYNILKLKCSNISTAMTSAIFTDTSPANTSQALLLGDSSPLMELRGVNRIFLQGEHSNEVLKPVNLTIGYGEFIAIEGASGSGKSTLLHILGLLDRPARVNIWCRAAIRRGFPTTI